MSDIVKTNHASSPAPNGNRAQKGYSPRPEDAVDAHRVVRLLLKEKFLILKVALLILIPAGISSYLTPTLFRASALLEISPDPVQVLPYRDVADNRSGVYYEVYMATQDQILKSPVLAARVTGRLQSEAADDNIRAELRFLRQRFEVKRIPNSQIYQINYLAPTPSLAARVVNIFAEEYIKGQFESRQATREKAHESLKRELDLMEKRTQASERELVRYAQRMNIVHAEPGQGGLVQKKLATLDKQVTDAEADLIVAETRFATIRKASAKDIPERLVTPVIANLTAKVLQMEQELTTLRATFGEKWPAVVTKRDELSLAQEQLERQKVAVLDQAVEQAQLDFHAAQSKLSMLTDSLAKQQELVNRSDNASIQYNILRREVETNQKLYEGLLERLKQTSVLAGFEFGNIQVIEPGRPENAVPNSVISRKLALACVLGLALGVCIVLLRDFWDRSLPNLEDAERLVALPGLGSIPLVKFPAAARAVGAVCQPVNGAGTKVCDVRPSSAVSLVPSVISLPQEMHLPVEMTEAIRNVCASILLSQSDRELRVIVITSAVPEEGKTTIIGQVARALADSGAKTLLVDSDLRNPGLSRNFGVSGENGLSLFLAGHVSPLPRIHKTDTENLFLVGAGPQPPNPAALFNSDRMSLFLKEMASTAGYRFVLLDAPPVLPVADARVLCSKADGVVMVVRARRTARNLLLRARDILENSGANLLGIVLNGADNDDQESSYYRNYYGKAYGNQPV